MKDVIKNTGESSIFLPITQNFINKKAPHERCFSYDIDIYLFKIFNRSIDCVNLRINA